ncbi:MAG: PAS domain S-box protein [Phenylobacterium sp.]|uniref:ATP-binding protein n=1 Tax=Phenylobacterium sp. TaxID=1871053 RepID=UPI001A20F397|nr:ATP-binding protein [Phenylobacterium sp.]MBJ7411405.1 PAS domain S-box protein [Phenylobacterium sp.]
MKVPRRKTSGGSRRPVDLWPPEGTPASGDAAALLKHLDRTERLSNTGSWRADVPRERLLWSAQVYRLFGLAPCAFRPTFDQVLDLIHPEDRERVRARVRSALAGEEAYDLDYRVVLADGGERIMRERGEVEFGPDGAPTLMFGSVQDVTGVRAAEEAARRSANTLAAMLTISPEAIVVTDQAARIIAFSVGAEETFGYAASEVLGQPVEKLLPARHRSAHEQHVAAFSAGGAKSLRMHDRAPIVGRRRSGEEFPAEVSLAVLDTATGDAFTAIVRDLSERRDTELRLIAAREQAEKANLAKSVFLANMSHEIRTPLNGVLGIAGALARTDLAPKQRHMVNLIEGSGRALERLLSDILDLAKLDAGRVSIREERFDLANAVREIAELFQASAAEKGVELLVELDAASRDRFIGDELRIRQVLSNLVSNAVKFTARGEVRLSVTCAPLPDGRERVRFAVRDTGIGFPPDAAETLFERFEQADGSVTRRYGGTGLGLAISKSLATLMGGTISATSAPGRGATFKVELPLRRVVQDGPILEVVQSSAIDGSMRPLRLLLAEDHLINRMTVELILEELPVEIVAVENGREAVEVFAGQAFDLVLMDMQMPVMDGLAAIRAIREIEREFGRARTPICVLSANAMDEHKEAAGAAGADAFLTKPINAGGLITYVAGVAAETA